MMFQRPFFVPLLLALVLHAPLAGAGTPPIETTVYTQKGELSLQLETATNADQREYGLMNRDTLKPADGMLFVFPFPGPYKFWMKNTLVPLDMLFIDADNTVTAIVPNVPPQTLKMRGPGTDVIAVIELDGGRAAHDGIMVGDKVRYVLPKDITVE